MISNDAPRPLRFLLAADRSLRAKPHLAYAVRLANSLGAEATLFHAAPLVKNLLRAAADPSAAFVSNEADEVRRAVSSVARSLKADRPVQVEIGPAAAAPEAILAATDRSAADLIVLPTHGRTGVSRAMFGSTAEEVLRRSTRPVLLLTDHMLANESEAAVERGPVVLATDLSPDAQVAHGVAADLARRLGVVLQLFSVVPAVEPFPASGGASMKPAQHDAAALLSMREQQLRKVAESFGSQDVDVKVLMDEDVAKTIVRSTSSSATSFLVLATHGRRGIERTLRGSVAEEVIRHATVPVLCMPMAKI
ncbi:MAG: nucleotide-binding universal stress UspA family protein [Planctomycetota bacterium]|jgi:nucleotide-binding universal stress UspA family protein